MQPTHKEFFYQSGRKILEAETHPLAKMESHKQYCRYCYDTHTDWWMMNQDDYQVEGAVIILCEKCEHTSEMEA